MSSINQQTPGPIVYYPPMEGRLGAILAGGFTPDNIHLASDNCAHLRVLHESVDEPEELANARLFAAAYSAFDKAGRELGIDAAMLARETDVAALIRFRAGVIKCLDQLSDSPLSLMDNPSQGIEDAADCMPKVRG